MKNSVMVEMPSREKIEILAFGMHQLYVIHHMRIKRCHISLINNSKIYEYYNDERGLLMKRIMAMVLASMVMVTFSLPVLARETDSIHLESEERSLLNASPEDTVVKVYANDIIRNFESRKDIADILADSEIMYMIVKDSGYISYYNFYKGQLTELRKETGVPDWSEFYTYAVFPSLVFESTIKVEQVYCLDGMSPWHVAIYYATDHGNYILYKKHLKVPETYLFPLNEFCLYAGSVVRSKGDGYSDSGVSNDESFDLEPYLFEAKQQPVQTDPKPSESNQMTSEPIQQQNEPNQKTNLFAAIISVAFVAAAAIAFGAYYILPKRRT